MKIKTDAIDNVLLAMAKKGELLCKCPLCFMFLNYEELKNACCNSCREINFGKIIMICNKELNKLLS